LQVNLERVKKQVVGERTKNVTKVTERSDLEQLFVNCVEDVRKEIIKRRLKAEIIARQRPNEQQVKDFENTLVKLADMAQNRVRLEEFTALDRIHILDLFVNNEKTLLRVHEVLFPGTSSFIKTQQLKNSSDMISIGVESGVHFNQRSDTHLNESITDLMMAMSSKKTGRHHLMVNISDDLMNTAATTI
jgi:HJR/Mrr/RecB family endonuclease